MRVLNSVEIESISGGIVGTPIPFTNSFIPGANWPGGGSGAVMGAYFAWKLGTEIGSSIYDWTTDTFDMSTGEALYLTTH